MDLLSMDLLSVDLLSVDLLSMDLLSMDLLGVSSWSPAYALKCEADPSFFLPPLSMPAP